MVDDIHLVHSLNGTLARRDCSEEAAALPRAGAAAAEHTRAGLVSGANGDGPDAAVYKHWDGDPIRSRMLGLAGLGSAVVLA
jgi:hypothetical protein